MHGVSLIKQMLSYDSLIRHCCQRSLYDRHIVYMLRYIDHWYIETDWQDRLNTSSASSSPSAINCINNWQKYNENATHGIIIREMSSMYRWRTIITPWAKTLSHMKTTKFPPDASPELSTPWDGMNVDPRVGLGRVVPTFFSFSGLGQVWSTVSKVLYF